MKVRELTTIIADIRRDADALELGARSAFYTNDTDTLSITFPQQSVIAATMRIQECCNRLEDLVPGIDIEIKGGSDASHCNDE